MIYRKYKIEDKFSPFVECIFSWEGVAKSLLSIETPPSSFCSIVFNYGASYYISNSKYPKLLMPETFLAGQAIRNYILNVHGEIGMIGIVFKPCGLFHYLGVTMRNYTEERVDLISLLSGSEEYSKLIRNSEKMADKLKVIRRFLNHLHDNGSYSNLQIVKASNFILDMKGNLNLSEVLENVYMSRRQFERNFLEHVGVSPKAYCKIRRFGYLCSLIAGKRKVNLTDLVYKSGYYDQSHFIKDFKYFAGRTPKFYVENNKELAHLIHEHEIVNDDITN